MSKHAVFSSTVPGMSNLPSWRELDADHFELALIASLIPPPVSLNILCRVSGFAPVKTLQVTENLIKQGILLVFEPEGSGYYCLRDPNSARELIEHAPQNMVKQFGMEIAQACDSEYSEGPRRWLTLAHICQVAQIPVDRPDDILRAGDYCFNLNLLDDAAVYYQLVIDRLESDCADPGQKEAFIDATIGICTCKERSLALQAQRTLLEKALGYATEMGDLKRQVKLLVLAGQIEMAMGEYDSAATAFDDAWQIVNRFEDHRELKRWTALASTQLLFWQGRVADAIQRHELVIGNLEDLALDSETLKACARLGWIYGINGQTARGLGLIDAVRLKANSLNLSRLMVYADLMSALTLIDARRIQDAEVYLERIAASSLSQPDRYVLWALHGMQSYVAFVHGNYEKSFEFQKLAYDNSKALGFRHHRGPFNFEYMDGLEERGLVHPEWNFDSEIERVLNWPDIYMQGVGFRYRARRILKRGGEREKALGDMERSIALLSRSGAKIELALSQVAIARLLIPKGEKERSQQLLREAWSVLSMVNERIFPQDLKKYVKEIDREEILINTLVEVSKSLGTVRSRHDLLNRIVNLTMSLSGAERGAFFLVRKDGRIEMVASRNINPAMVNDPPFEGSYQAVQNVISSGEESVIGSFSKSSSLSAFDQTHERWSICYPVVLKGTIIGAMYMDGGLGQMILPEKSLPLLKAIGTQVAVALDNVTAYEEIAELKDQLQAETEFYRRDPCALKQLEQIVGHSAPIRRVFEHIQSVAASDSSVFIHGETGVGKELVARAVHALSNRKNGPFIPVNIASLSEGLLASELFGHEKGAFTGAAKAHRGRFELARNGTLFLDDVDALTSEVQVKLLRVLEEMEYERVGGSQTIKANFRLISASNQNLSELVKKGLFRSDLYFRLNVFPIDVPPLRERREDVPDLANHFLGIFSRKFGKDIAGISRQDMERMMAYSWPGNVRELRHVIERAVLLSQGQRLTIPALDETSSTKDAADRFLSYRQMEAQYILKALEHCNWKISGRNGAAELLQLKPTTLSSKMNRLGIALKKSVTIKKY